MIYHIISYYIVLYYIILYIYYIYYILYIIYYILYIIYYILYIIYYIYIYIIYNIYIYILYYIYNIIYILYNIYIATLWLCGYFFKSPWVKWSYMGPTWDMYGCVMTPGLRPKLQVVLQGSLAAVPKSSPESTGCMTYRDFLGKDSQQETIVSYSIIIQSLYIIAIIIAIIAIIAIIVSNGISTFQPGYLRGNEGSSLAPARVHPMFETRNTQPAPEYWSLQRSCWKTLCPAPQKRHSCFSDQKRTPQNEGHKLFWSNWMAVSSFVPREIERKLCMTSWCRSSKILDLSLLMSIDVYWVYWQCWEDLRRFECIKLEPQLWLQTDFSKDF